MSSVYEQILRQMQYTKEQTGNYPWKIVLGEDSSKAFKKELETDFKGADVVINDLGTEIEYWETE